MNISNLYLFLIVIVVFGTNKLQAQNPENQLAVQKIYDFIQDKNTTTREVAALMPAIDWEKLKLPEGVDPRNTITFCALMKNQWGSILFRDLEFKQIAEDKVVVTGIVNGRQPSECEYISSRFTHNWTLRNGEIITFTE